MIPESLTNAIDRVRALAAQADHDPRALFDETQKVIDQLEAAGETVPRDLRENAAELEGEIVDEFFDNMPV